MMTIYPQILQRCRIDLVAELAIEIRQRHSRMKPPRISLLEIIADMGVDLNRNASQDILLIEDQGKSIHACIHLRTKQPWEEQFALAHLLSHLLLHALPKLESGRLHQLTFTESEDPFHRFQKRSYDQIEDHQADQLAKELLVPRAMLQKTRTKMSELSSIAEFFNVHPLLLDAPMEHLSPNQTPHPLSRLRALARKIDQTVKP